MDSFFEKNYPKRWGKLFSNMLNMLNLKIIWFKGYEI